MRRLNEFHNENNYNIFFHVDKMTENIEEE